MRLLVALHRAGVNMAIVAGLLLMPAVVAVGYWADGQDKPFAEMSLRGSIAPGLLGPGSPAVR